MSFRRSWQFLLGATLILVASSTAAERVYFGTYTRGTESKGIYVADFDPASGAVTNVRVAAASDNPSFLAIHPNGRFLYAACEVTDFQGKKEGSVASFAIDAETGSLKMLNHQSSRGGAPCHLVVDRSGRCVLSANYGGGSVCVHPIGEDGQLREATAFVQHTGKSVNPRRQEAPHAHSVNVDLANQFAFVADLGLDQVISYRLDAKAGTLTANPAGTAKLKPGAGPRHFAFHPGGQFAFTNNEMDSSVTALRYDAERGALTVLDTLSTLPAGFNGDNSTAECLAHPSGRFVYVSNRGHDSIAMFAFDAATGKLTHLGNESTQGRTPRNFNLDPSGQWLLAENQASSTVVVLKVDVQTGKLVPTGTKVDVPSPVCARFWK